MLDAKEIGLQLEHLSSESFLWIDVTLLVFKIVGKEPHVKKGETKLLTDLIYHFSLTSKF